MGNLAEAGRKEMASDCWVRFEEKDKGGLSIEVKSKVKSLYGDSIKNTALDMLKSSNRRPGKPSLRFDRKNRSGG